MKPWSWFKSTWFPMMFPSINQQGLAHKRDENDSSENDDDYYDYYPLPNVPFVYREIESRSTLKPCPRSGHRIVSDSHGNVYCLGGYNPEGLNRDDSTDALFKELWKFNMSSLIWTKIDMTGDPPQLLCSFGALCIDDMLFIQGGTGVPFGGRGSNKLYVCKLANGEWKKYRLKAVKKDIPPKFYGQALAFDLDEMAIYSVGGTCGHTYHSGVSRINLRDGSADLLYPYNSLESTGSYRHEIVLYNNKIYLFGGGTQDHNIGFEQLFYFDLTNKCWKSIKTFGDRKHGYPVARKFHGLVSLEAQVFIVGGGSSRTSEFGPIGRDDVWKFDLETMEWTFICKLPRPIYFHSATISHTGLMTIFGGVQSIREDSAIRIQRTNEIGTIWLKIPSLRELAWIAFLNNCADITKISQSQLLDIGVPPSYVARLVS